MTADNLSRIYGNANPVLTYQIGGLGLVNGDQLSGSLATLADQTSNVGSYAITQGTLAASSNYALTFSDGTLDVTQRGITVTADNLSRIYGNANPVLTYQIAVLAWSTATSCPGSLATLADQTSNVGSYAITQGTLAASSNYALTFSDGTLDVTQRGITVTADNLSRIYGNANPVLTYQIGGLGLVNGDQLSGSLATLADQTSNVGSYAITQGTLAASSNYALTFSDGTLDVTQRGITGDGRQPEPDLRQRQPCPDVPDRRSWPVNGDRLSGSLATLA